MGDRPDISAWEWVSARYWPLLVGIFFAFYGLAVRDDAAVRWYGVPPHFFAAVAACIALTIWPRRSMVRHVQFVLVLLTGLIRMTVVLGDRPQHWPAVLTAWGYVLVTNFVFSVGTFTYWHRRDRGR